MVVVSLSNNDERSLCLQLRQADLFSCQYYYYSATHIQTQKVHNLMQTHTSNAHINAHAQTHTLQAMYDLMLEEQVTQTHTLQAMYDLILEERVTQTHTLQAMYDLILEERVTQGYWLTGLELAVEQVPSEEAQWTMVRV